MRHGNADVGLNHRTEILVGVAGQRWQLLECGVDDVVEEDAQDLIFAREIPVNGSSCDTGALCYDVDASGVKALLVEQIFSSLQNLLFAAHRVIILNIRLPLPLFSSAKPKHPDLVER